MALRAASGNLRIANDKKRSGTVIIDINSEPNVVDPIDGARDASIMWSREIGSGEFPNLKCKMVSIKDFQFGDRATGGWQKKRLNLDDDFVDIEGKAHLRIHWATEGDDAGILEISYIRHSGVMFRFHNIFRIPCQEL